MWTTVEERAQYYMERIAIYDAIYRVDADDVTTYVNRYGIDWAEDGIFDTGGDAMVRVLFSQAGTYLQFYRDGSMELSYWKWQIRPMVHCMPMMRVRWPTEPQPQPFSMETVSM